MRHDRSQHGPTVREVTGNARRAQRTEQIVRHHSRVPGYEGGADYEADITDLMTDLRHFCAGSGLDFDRMAESSRRHYEAERKEEPSRRRRRKPNAEPKCPHCGRHLECFPDQDGSCDWRCAHCGWSQHAPPERR